MIFRLGGLFLLLVVPAVLLARYSPAFMLLLLLYPGLVIFVVRRYRAAPPIHSGRLPPWPLNRRRQKLTAVIAICSFVGLVLVGSVLHSDVIRGFAVMLFLLGLSLMSFYAAASCIRFGYFPDTPRGRGVSRNTDPIQFWVFTAVFLAFGFMWLCFLYSLVAPHF
jgi:hypothetical protein